MFKISEKYCIQIYSSQAVTCVCVLCHVLNVNKCLHVALPQVRFEMNFDNCIYQVKFKASFISKERHLAHFPPMSVYLDNDKVASVFIYGETVRKQFVQIFVRFVLKVICKYILNR